MFICIPIALAANFTVNVDTIDNTILLKGTATFGVTIKNNGAGTDTFEMYSLTYPTWEVKPEDNINVFKLLKDESITKKILVTPLHVDKVGGYVVSLKVKQDSTKNIIEIPLMVEIRTEQQLYGKYIPTVLLVYQMDEKIDPRKEIPISITLDNQNTLNLEELMIKIESGLIHDEISTTLGPREVKTVKAVERLDPLTKPQEDTIFVSVLRNNSVIANPKAKRYEIMGTVDLSQKEKTEKSFLTITKKIEYSNSGNKVYEGTLKVDSKRIRAFFTSTKPKGKLTTVNNSVSFSWNAKIEPAGTFSVEVSENYRPLFIILVIIIVIIIIYFIFRSPLIIRKNVSNIEKKEGGISEMRIVLNVKNRGRRPLENILIVDRVPDIVSIEKGISIGTLHPERIMARPHKGHLIKWMIDKLGESEERVISYCVKSKLSILGDMDLEPAVAKGHVGKREIIVRSNIVSISS